MEDTVNEKDLVDNARKLGYDYFSIYEHCAPTTLLAVSDTLGLDISDDAFKSSIGLSGWSGGCGGICGGIAAVGIYFGTSREEFAENPDLSRIQQAAEYIRSKFVETYGSYLCDDILTKVFGDSENISDTELMKKCPLVTENAAGWAVEAILATRQK